MPQQVEAKVKRQRSQKMLALAEECALNFCQQFLGRTMIVLFEQRCDGIWSGLTENYIRIYTKSDRELTNQLLPVRLLSVWRDGVWGRIAET